jgi:hypothetical protein
MFGVVEIVDETVCITIEGTAALVLTSLGGWRGSLLRFDKICAAL